MENNHRIPMIFKPFIPILFNPALNSYSSPVIPTVISCYDNYHCYDNFPVIPYWEILTGLLTCKRKNSQIEREKKSQIKSAMIKKKFLKILKPREFRIFKKRFVGFYLYTAADLRFFSLQFLNFTLCKLPTISKFALKEIKEALMFIK
jgi:hypothetical protein